MQGAARGTVAALAALALASAPAGAVSFRAERELGRRFALAARARLPLLHDPDLLRFVRTVGGRIVARLEDSFFDYRFAVVRDPSINAFAVPGGYVYVHTGLLVAVASEDELAAVLGHEVAHVHAHHLARQQESSQLMSHAALLGVLLSVLHPAIGAVASAASAAQQLHYRREFEQEADYLGARYAQAAGYDAGAMLDFFDKLAAQQRVAGAAPPPYLLTHPLTDERMTRLQGVLRTLQRPPHTPPPPSLELRRVRALAALRQGPPLEIVARYREAYQGRTGDPVEAYLYGLVALEAGQLDSAGGALESAYAAGVAGSARDLGRLALRRRDLARAQQLLREAVEADPEDALAWFDLGRALLDAGDAGAARDALRRAVEREPELADAHRQLGILEGRSEHAGRGFYHLGVAAYLEGEYPRAVEQLERAARLLPEADPDRRAAEQLAGELRETLELQPPRPSPPARPHPPGAR